MAKNTLPIYSLDARHSTDGTATSSSTLGAALTSAANDYTGASANNAVVFTADATEGGFLQALRVIALGTNVASVLRVYLNNGSAATSAGNNTLIDEIPLPATTASATTITGPGISRLYNMRLYAGERIVVGLATAVSAGWRVTGIGSKF